MSEEGDAQSPFAERVAEEIRKRLEAAGLGPVEMSVHEDGEQVVITGTSWEVRLAKGRFIRIRETNE